MPKTSKWNRFLVAALIGLGAGMVALPAQADTFPAGSWIIPRDECWQYSGGGLLDVAELQNYCPNASSPGTGYATTGLGALQTADDGMLKSFGMVWFLLRNGIRAFMIINADKTAAPGCPALVSSPSDEVEGSIDSRDFCVDGNLSPAAPGDADPVKLLDKNTGALVDFLNSTTYQHAAYRGGAVVIHKDDTAAALALLQTGTTPVPWGVNDAGRYVNFDAVDIHVAQADFDAEVFDVTNKRPAILAVGEHGNSDIFYNYLKLAGLSDWCSGGGCAASADIARGCAQQATAGLWYPHGDWGACNRHGEVYDTVVNAAINAGALMDKTNNDYRVLWYPHYSYGNGPNDDQVFGQMHRQFLDGGGSIVGGCHAVLAFENDAPGNGAVQTYCATHEGASCISPTNTVRYMSVDGIIKHSPDLQGNAPPLGYDSPGHPFVQMGNARYRVSSGSLHNWKPTASGYTSVLPLDDGGVARLLYSKAGTGLDSGDSPTVFTSAEADQDVMTIRYKDGCGPNAGCPSQKGLVVYLGGHDFDKTDSKGTIAGIRLYINTMFAIETLVTPVIKEVTRSSPLVKADQGLGTEASTFIFQGSWVDVTPPPDNSVFDWDPAMGFAFPATAGHLRVYDQTQLTATRQDFETITSHWDGASQLPADTGANVWPADFTTRNIFTATTSGSSGIDSNYLGTKVEFIKANVSATMDVCGADGAKTTAPTAETDLLIDTVRGANLGGIDRSSPVYIDASENVANAANSCTGLFTPSGCRQNALYVGALDGMLHAFATADVENASASAPWGSLKEFWSFIPPDQLSRLRDNTARVNSTPLVVDTFGDFYSDSSHTTPGKDGAKEWKTVLFFSTTGRNPTEQKFYFAGSSPGDYHCGDGGTPPTNVRTDYHIQRGQGTVWALDVSNPRNPRPLWKSAPASMGASRGVAAGVANCAGAPKGMVFVVSKVPGATPTPGFNVFGLDAETGSKIWERNFVYTLTPQGGGDPNVVLNPPLLVESATAAVSSGLNVTPPLGCSNLLFIGDAEGNVWKLNPLDGTDIGTQPYYDAKADSNTNGCSSSSNIKCPLSVIRPAYDSSGNLHLVMVTGTFDWPAPGIRAQIINLDTSKVLNSSPANPIVTSLGSSERIYGDPVIYGDDIYLQSSEGNVNAIDNFAAAGGKGHIYKISLTSGAQSRLTALPGEDGLMSGSTLAIGHDGDVIAAGAQGMVKKANTAAPGNVPVTTSTAPPRFRLWLQNFKQ